MEVNTELLRWILLIGAAPIWWPFLRTLWRDFDETLAEEGGVFGRPPGPKELERIRARKRGQPDPLISEPWARPSQQGSGRARAPSAESGFQRKPRGGGFR
jgi:hypothetical protein